MRERWQRFTEEAETWLLDVIFQQRPGKKAEGVRFVLLGLSRGTFYSAFLIAGGIAFIAASQRRPEGRAGYP